MYALANKKIWVAGHNGMVGRACCAALMRQNTEVLTAPRDTLDLTRQDQVEKWLADTKPDAVVVCAAQVGGILANNTYPVEFLYTNIMIASNIIRTAHEVGVEKLLFLGSSCAYPKDAAQPIAEAALLSGALEPTNQWYAIAKIAGIKLCQAYRTQYGDDFISVMPTNLYGTHDNFDLATSHVLPALLHKCHQAKAAGAANMEVWGSGNPKREFMYVDDCAEGIVFLLQNYSADAPINLGVGRDVSITQLAKAIKDVVGFTGDLTFNASKPDGSPRKLLDVSALTQLGWQAKTDLHTGLKHTYEWYCNNIA
ncbi:MAG: GDP-L-fucose synthase [Alphaproteobacteria bacterium]|nr:GDP-L-fucose synthase [Alphaproteobacteria bacterium]